MEISIIRFIIGFAFILTGLVIFGLQMFGIFKFKYVLNRMHAAAMGDTLGISMILLGLMIMYGISFSTLKLGLIIVFLWCSSPVASHVVAALQVETDENIDMHLVKKPLSDLEKENMIDKEENK